VHRIHGYLLPRDADLQYADRRLQSVSRARLRAGDLVFFRTGRHRYHARRPGARKRAFVNATTHGAPVVRIDRLDDPYWKRLYRGARRLPRAPED